VHIVIAVVLAAAAAADAVLVAHRHQQLGAHLIIALARLCARNLADTREKRRKLRVKVWHGKQVMPVARARAS
jgi:hypothetical protein